METLCLTVAFGFLRCAEFSTPSISSFPALGLKCSDLSQIPGNHFILFIRSSKTVQLSQGFCIFCQIPSSSTAPDLYLRDTGSHPVYAPSRHGSDFLLLFFPPFILDRSSCLYGQGRYQHLIKSMGRWISSAVNFILDHPLQTSPQFTKHLLACPEWGAPSPPGPPEVSSLQGGFSSPQCGRLIGIGCLLTSLVFSLFF